MKSIDFLDNLLGLLTVELIMTPKDEFVTCHDNELITQLVNRLKKYDFLPVSAKEIKYFVLKTKVEDLLTKNLTATVEEIKQPISEKELILDNTPINNYFLKCKNPLFVNKENEVIGIVTLADLNKTPSKMLFYILISGLEQLLTKSIKSLNLSENKIEGIIGFNRLWNAKGRNEWNTRRNLELSLIECLNTCDLLKIACKRPRIRKMLNYPDEKVAKKYLNPLDNLRNKVMHTGHSIIQNEDQLLKRRLEYRLIRKHINDLKCVGEIC